MTFFIRLLRVTPQNPRFRSRQVIVTYIDNGAANRCATRLPDIDVASSFLFFNRDRRIFLHPVLARPVPVLPAIPRPPPVLPELLVF